MTNREKEAPEAEWIQNWAYGFIPTKPFCSKCGEAAIGIHGFDYKLTPRCPNCGAKMKEAENDSSK